MVPEGWKRLPIKEACESIIDCVNKTAPVVDFETPFKMIRTTNVRNGKVNTNDVRYVTEDIYQQWTRRGKPQAGDIIFTREAPVGEVGILEDADGVFLGQRTMMYRANLSRSDNYYLFYSLLSSFCQKQVEDFSNGGTVAHMRVPDCGEILINLPPLPEQKKIAQILSTWDKAITATEQLLTNSQQQKKALMQQLLTGKKRLLDKNGVRFSGEWKKIAIGKIIKEIKKEKEVNPNSIELLTVKIHYKGVTRSGKFPNATERGRPYFRRYKGELIIGRQNLHNGGIAIVSDECNGLISSNAISSFEARKSVDINFILSVMSTEHFRFTVDNLAGGTGQKEISVKDLLSLSLIVPDFEEQQKIAAVLCTADQEISALQQKLDALKQEKRALMQQLLTGKRRVKVDNKEG